MGKLSNLRVGLIGAGDLGAAMARAFVEHGGLSPASLTIHTRSGRSARLSDIAGIRFAPTAEAAAADADITVLAVPPAQIGTVHLGNPGGAVISVMAGVTLDKLAGIAGHARVIRAMSSPAAAFKVAFSVYAPAPACTPGDIALAAALLESCGAVDAVPDEAQIDLFTALIGPVPGFAAAFAAMLANWAEARGVDAGTADRAVRQLMLASGLSLAHTPPTPAERVREMVDYAGTTAAGLNALAASGAEQPVFEALDAAVAKARVIAG